MRTRLGKIVIGAVIGAGALGAGFGASTAVAGAATTHDTSSTSSSSQAAKTTISAATPSPAPSRPHGTTRNCPNMKGAPGARQAPSGRASTGS